MPVQLTRKLPDQLLQLIQGPPEPTAAQPSASLMWTLRAGLLRHPCCRLEKLQQILVRQCLFSNFCGLARLYVLTPASELTAAVMSEGHAGLPGTSMQLLSSGHMFRPRHQEV